MYNFSSIRIPSPASISTPTFCLLATSPVILIYALSLRYQVVAMAGVLSSHHGVYPRARMQHNGAHRSYSTRTARRHSQALRAAWRSTPISSTLTVFAQIQADPGCTPMKVCIPTHLVLASSANSSSSIGPCYSQSKIPERRYDPRYLAIGKQLTSGDNYVTAPLRNTKGRKRARGSSASASLSQSRDSSASSTRSDLEITENAEVPICIVSTDVARPIVNKFRPNVLGGTNGCAISGKGRSWLDGLPGTGIEAAHIVPQLHWAVYPLGAGGIARAGDHRQLEMAWRRTWA